MKHFGQIVSDQKKLTVALQNATLTELQARAERAEAEVKRLREALQPIADMAKNCAGDIGWKGQPNAKVEWVRVKHVLAAIEALEGKP